MPKAITRKIIEEVKIMVVGKYTELIGDIQRMIEYYAKIGVSKDDNIASIEEIDSEKLLILRSTTNAIKERASRV